MTMQLVSVGSTQIPLVQYQGQPVVTFAMIDKVHERPEDTASRNFKYNRERFIEGRHYYVADFSKRDELRPFGIEVPPRGLTLITERGYLKLVKTFSDDLAWDVQEQLIDGYFRASNLAAPNDPTVDQPTLTLAQLQPEVEAALALARLAGFVGNHQFLSADTAIKKRYKVSWLGLLGSEKLIADQRGLTYIPTELGKLMNPPISARRVNQELKNAGFQNQDASGSWYPTDKANRLFEWVDTGKRHSDGTPVKQLRWFSEVLTCITTIKEIRLEKAA